MNSTIRLWEKYKHLLYAFFVCSAFLVPYSIKILGVNLRTASFPFFALGSALFLYQCYVKRKDFFKNVQVPNIVALLFFLYAAIATFIAHKAGFGIPLDCSLKAFAGITLNTICLYMCFSVGKRMHFLELLWWLIFSGLILTGVFFLDQAHQFNIYDVLFDGVGNYQFQGAERRYIGNLRPITRGTGPFISPILAGWTLILPFASSIIFLFYNHNKQKFKKLLACFLIFIGCFFPVSYSSILGILVILYFVIVYSSLKINILKPLEKIILFSATHLVLLYILIFSKVSYGFISLFEYLTNGTVSQVGNFSARFSMIYETFTIWRERDFLAKLIGKGLGLQFYAEEVLEKELLTTDFSFYMTLLLEVGVIGLILFLAYVLSEAYSCWKLSKEASDHGLKMCFFTLFAFHIALFFTFIGFYHYVLFFIYPIAALIKLSAKEHIKKKDTFITSPSPRWF